MKWTMLLTQSFPRSLLSAAIVSYVISPLNLDRDSAVATSAVEKWTLIADSSFWMSAAMSRGIFPVQWQPRPAQVGDSRRLC